MRRIIDNFEIGDRAMRYSQFVPRLYNYCLSLGFQRQRMMPSRAFCSDESQGYPVILIAQHFGTFPFDHGRVGGKVAINRHGPYAHHGEDLVIIHADHVGYDAEPGVSASTSGSAPRGASSATTAASCAQCCIGIRMNIAKRAIMCCAAYSAASQSCMSTISISTRAVTTACS